MTELKTMRCEACEGGVAPMTKEEAMKWQVEIPKWTFTDDAKMIARSWEFKDFSEAFAFLTKVAGIAEAEGHHPNIWNSWNKVKLELTTHAIGGLSMNDLIVAAKIDRA
jgi:4a-hydroxytetrahydrobiopterin dehydratase